MVWQVPQPLDVARMAAAAAALVGDHDFAAFQASGGDVKTTRRRLTVSDLARVDILTDEPVLAPPVSGSTERHPLIRYEVTGTGFLRHMVRTIVGTLVEIGRGRLAAEAMVDILQSRDRRKAGMTAPPHGLMLWRVDY